MCTNASLPQSWEDLPEDQRTRLAAEMDDNNRRLAAGEIQAHEFTAEDGQKAMARLHRRTGRQDQ